jgi:nicotinate-nucleotide--dimethylbenzimidazole phosphoribosyltransferase
MVANMLAGGAAVSVLARQHGLALTVVDCGVAARLPPQPGLVVAKVRAGTADCSQGPAMSVAECEAAMATRLRPGARPARQCAAAG